MAAMTAMTATLARLPCAVACVLVSALQPSLQHHQHLPGRGGCLLQRSNSTTHTSAGIWGEAGNYCKLLRHTHLPTPRCAHAAPPLQVYTPVLNTPKSAATIAEALCEDAARTRARMLVVAVHGEGSMAQFGSVARYCCQHSKVPVMLLPAQVGSRGGRQGVSGSTMYTDVHGCSCVLSTMSEQHYEA
jgi:hypothetical protein